MPDDALLSHHAAAVFVDVAGERTEYELERALDDALHRNIIRLAQIQDALARAGAHIAAALALGSARAS